MEEFRMQLKSNVRKQVVLINNDSDKYVEIVIIVGDREIFRSGLIPPRKSIEEIELNSHLTPGKYAAYIQYNYYSVMDYTRDGSKTVHTELEVVE